MQPVADFVELLVERVALEGPVCDLPLEVVTSRKQAARIGTVEAQ